jgi:hypothetical protein
VSKSEHIQRPAKNFLQRFSKCNPVSVNISTVPNFPGNWKVSPIRLVFSAFVFEIPHPCKLYFHPTSVQLATCKAISHAIEPPESNISMYYLSQIKLKYCIFNSNNNINALYSWVP